MISQRTKVDASASRIDMGLSNIFIAVGVITLALSHYVAEGISSEKLLPYTILMIC